MVLSQLTSEHHLLVLLWWLGEWPAQSKKSSYTIEDITFCDASAIIVPGRSTLGNWRFGQCGLVGDLRWEGAGCDSSTLVFRSRTLLKQWLLRIKVPKQFHLYIYYIGEWKQLLDKAILINSHVFICRVRLLVVGRWHIVQQAGAMQLGKCPQYGLTRFAYLFVGVLVPTLFTKWPICR